MKKLMAIALAAVMACGALLTGCGGDKADTSLEDVKKKGQLVMGLDDSFPPMGFRDENQNIVGFDVDVAKEVAKRMGVELKLQPIDWKAKEQELDTGNVDCLWNGFTKTAERGEKMNLSDPYMKNTQVVVVLADSDIKTLDDLAGKTVIVQGGSTAEEAVDAKEGFKDTLKELVVIEDNVKAMMDLGVGGSDAVIMDEVVARYYTEKEAGKYRLLDDTLADEEYVVGFRKNDQTLRDEVQKYLNEMAKDGTLASIADTWFGKDITTVGK